MPGDTGSELIQQAVPDKSPAQTPNNARPMARPNLSLGQRVESFSRRAIAPLLLAVGVATAVNAPQAINAAPSQDTGYKPNQPGQTEKPKPSQPPEVSEYHQNEWADRVRLVLEGKADPNTSDGEVFLKHLVVKQTAEDPNIRDGFPSTMTGASFDGTPPAGVPILGKLPGGTEIDGRVLEVTGNVDGRENKWIATLAKNLQGKAIDANGNPVQFENPNQVVTIERSYFAPGDNSAQAPAK